MQFPTLPGEVRERTYDNLDAHSYDQLRAVDRFMNDDHTPWCSSTDREYCLDSSSPRMVFENDHAGRRCATCNMPEMIRFCIDSGFIPSKYAQDDDLFRSIDPQILQETFDNMSFGGEGSRKVRNEEKPELYLEELRSVQEDEIRSRGWQPYEEYMYHVFHKTLKAQFGDEEGSELSDHFDSDGILTSSDRKNLLMTLCGVRSRMKRGIIEHFATEISYDDDDENPVGSDDEGHIMGIPADWQ